MINSQDVTQMRCVNFIFLVTLLLLQLRIWVGDGSLAHTLAIQQKIETQSALNDQLQKRNARLMADVLSLQQGTQGIEQYARTELGLIKPDETFYLVLSDAVAQ